MRTKTSNSAMLPNNDLIERAFQYVTENNVFNEPKCYLCNLLLFI